MIYLLLIVYQVKHFVCDYLLQGRYMIGKFKPYPAFIVPLLAHVGVHGVFTYLIVLCIKPKSAFWLALSDMVIHFTMDRIKASPNMLGRFKALSGREYVQLLTFGISPDGRRSLSSNEVDEILKSNTLFWWSLGLDQGVHHLTHCFIIWYLMYQN